MHRSFRIAAMAAAVLPLAAVSAEARIKCRDGYQISGGREISTPYCNDEQLAHVARERGMKVSADEVRHNPNLKDEVCRFVGYDIRVRNYCPDNSGSDRND